MNAYNPTEPVTESDRISADIQHTRESMDHTLDKIGAKMKPRHLLDEVLGFLNLKNVDGDKLKNLAGAAADSASEGAERVAHAIGAVIRQHPIPTLLVGAGLAYAIYESRRGPHERGGRYAPHESGDKFRVYPGNGLKERATEILESGRDSLESVKEKAKAAVASAGQHLEEKSRSLREHAGASIHAIGEKASQLKDQVAESAQRGYEIGREKFVHTSQEHPLSVGLSFLAAGVLVGMALPHSHKEDQLMGQAADRIKDRAKAEGEDLYERGKHVATAAAEAVKESAEREGLTSHALLEKAERVVSAPGQAPECSPDQGEPEPSSPAPIPKPSGPASASSPHFNPDANANP